ncbi:peptidoglycan D,D-transpeptidase FtsI family protein [Pseudactinotalea sp. Z1739]|uniref:peptidoglycan D,D-transpeptidase FtsI family protein n=1 Tax=Pseudactinotalea sp. Z1739 TaxID=3413028 RepID=UPI003C7ABCAE
MAGPTPMTGVGAPVRRQNIILAAILIVVLLFGVRLVYIQVIAGPALAQTAREERTHTQIIPAPRGDVVDAHGTVLATSADTFDIVADLRQIPSFVLRDEDGEIVSRGAAAAARVLAPLLDRDPAELGAELVGDNGYHRLLRNATPETWQAIASLGVNGITAERTSQRVYPAGNTAGNILGWVNDEGDGAAGIESTLNSRLLGTPGSSEVEIGARGQVIPTGAQSSTPAVPGCDVHLTIDTDLQWHAQQVIDESVDSWSAAWGAVVVVEVGTGRILALADSHAVDPNSPMDTPEDSRGARSVQNAYDPGSTGKVLTVLSALEEGVVTPTSPIENPYRHTMPNGQSFTDHTEHPDQVLTTTGVLAESANTSTVLIGSEMSNQTRFEYMRNMGWGERTGMGLPGETAGILHHYSDWDGRTQYVTMFGQSVNVNLVANTQVFATIANQGMAIPPRIIEGYTCEGAYEELQDEDPVQVVSPESSEQMIRMLESTVHEGGTGVRAAIDGYRVAGKTGTAETSDGRGGLSHRVASFVGVAPAEAPEIAVGVVVAQPSGIYGSLVAAPVFHDVTEFSLQHLGVAPSTEEPDLYPLRPEDS